MTLSNNQRISPVRTLQMVFAAVCCPRHHRFLRHVFCLLPVCVPCDTQGSELAHSKIPFVHKIPAHQR